VATRGTEDGPTEITAEFPFPAPAEVVFNTLTDKRRITRWLPTGVSAQMPDRDQLEVHSGTHSRTFRVSVVPSELRVEWSLAEGGPTSGSARVRETGAGGSTVEVELRVDPAAASEQRVRTLLGEAAQLLQRDVDDNFTAG